MSIEYINNKDFEKLIKVLLENQDDEDIKHEVTVCFYLLADNIIRAFKFKLIDREDALQEAVLACLQKIDRFDPDRGKAFNWFTTIILNHFRQLYRSAKNYVELKRRFLEREALGKTATIFEENSSGTTRYIQDRIRRDLDQYSEYE